MPLLPAIETNPAQTAENSVIWLHGLGADGHDFAPLVPELDLPDTLAVRFIFPHAPSIPVTINNGYIMPAWYDITELSTLDRHIDRAGLEASALAVHKLIDREIERGVAPEKIIIAGFSQGGAVGYEAALSYPKTLGGLMTLSTYFATHNSIALHPGNASIPLFISHGTQDDVVPEQLGQQAFELLLAKGYRPEYKTYAMGHSVCPEQIVDIAAWLKKTLA